MTGYNFNSKSSLEENHRVLWLLGEKRVEREKDRERQKTETDRQADRQAFRVNRTQNKDAV